LADSIEVISMLAAAAPLFLSLAPQTNEPPEIYELVRVEESAVRAAPLRFAALGFDHVARDAETGEVEFAASESELAKLASAGFRWRVMVGDLASFYASRLDQSSKTAGQFGAWLSPPFAQGQMGGYYTYNQVVSVLDQIHAAYPSLTTAKASLGTTVEGRTIWMMKISDNPTIDENEPEVRIDALHHAREPESMQASLWFTLYLLESYNTDPLAKYLVDNREIFFVPVVNADGYVYNQTTNPGGGGMWRKNRRNNGGGVFGVDINRNYNDHWGWDNSGSSPTTSAEDYRGPSAASEPETQAMQGFIASRQFATSLSIHTYSDLWLYPFGYAQIYPANNAQYVEISNLATAVNHYEVGPPSFILYLANGVTCDYDHDVKGTMAWSPELGSSSDGFWPPTNRIVPLADENLLALQRTTLAAGAWMRVLSTTLAEIGDGDGFYEAGESIAFSATVRNSGRAASSTSVALSIASSSPWITITNGNYDFGAIASFSQASNSGSPLSISIAANAPGGTLVPYTLSLSYEGWTQSIPGQFVIGEPVPFLIDDAELDWGWTKGVAGDTATSGIWTRGVPIGTSSSGAPANPSIDHTPAPGVACYMTGNGGGSAGTDDVDNGATTLVSPIFDLSNVGAASLSYARWFADLSVADDTFAISISNDGGQSWVPLENVAGNANAWNPVAFDVSSVLPQTASMRLKFVASDNPNNSVVEAAIDDLAISIYDAAPKLNVYGKSTAGSKVLVNVTGAAGAKYQLQTTLIDPQSSGGSSSPFVGHIYSRAVQTGTIPANRLAQVQVTVPTGALFFGRTIWYRAIVIDGTNVAATNWDSLTVQ
jgi:hypothetical protein